MKKITFNKLGKYGTRPNYPGYAFEHSSHPGMRLAIARGSARVNKSDDYKLNNRWHLYDLDTGVSLTGLIGNCFTREQLLDTCRAHLFRFTSEQLRNHAREVAIKFTTRSLQQGLEKANE